MSDTHIESIEQALAGPMNEVFWTEYADGVAICGHAESFYAAKIPDRYLLFDVFNNKALANVNLDGSIRHFSTYRGCYPSDSLAPGIWWYKDFLQTGPFFYELELAGERFCLHETDWPLRTDLLSNMFPVTTLQGPGVEVKLITFAPVSADGQQRPRGVFYGMLLRNTSDAPVAGKVIPPQSQPKTSTCYESVNVYISLADGLATEDGTVSFNLAPGETLWTPAVISSVPGETTMAEIAQRTSTEWLAETTRYFRGMLGELTTPGDPFLAAFFERSVLGCAGGIAMDAASQVVGANWSAYPSTLQIWMKDFYHLLTPLVVHEPALLTQCILWFLDKSVRHAGDKVYEGYRLRGGVSFSLTNTLTPVVLSGMYYEATGDRTFFDAHPEVLAKCTELLDAVFASREGEPYLYPSEWLSDGLSRSDYHTGSNVLAWLAFARVADIVEDVAGDVDLAARYREIATRTRADIERWCIADGPMGPQYAEGAFADGTHEMHHDGEETDTTLMPHYRYCDYDNAAHQANCRVAMTADNRWYKPNTKGIRDSTWISDPVPSIDATYPGYMTGLAGVQTAEEMNGPDGLMTRIRERVDIEGSIWWWPFREDKISRAYEIHGGLVGKCGWAFGVFASHFVSQILGLSYDGRGRVLRFKPFSPTSDFMWDRARLGSGVFSVSFARGDGDIECCVTNHTDHAVTVAAELILPDGAMLAQLTVDGDVCADAGAGTFFAAATVMCDIALAPGASTTAKATYQR